MVFTRKLAHHWPGVRAYILKGVVLISLAAATGVLASLIIQWRSASPPPQSYENVLLDRQDMHDHLMKLIATEGPAKAYSDFKRINEDAPIDDKHINAHLFGELLYEQQLPDGISICDSSFSLGCYHGYMGAMVETEGLTVLSSLDAACQHTKNDWLGCYHGIGHGLVSYLGRSRLIEALELCNTLAWQPILRGCGSGVFMEYNFGTIHDPPAAASTSVRAFDADIPYAPCATLPDTYQQSCYFEAPDWWRFVLRGNFVKIANLCSGVSNPLYQKNCFLGTGSAAAQYVHSDIAASTSICDLMPTPSNQALCRAGAFIIILGSSGDFASSISICESLQPEATELCRKEANSFLDVSIGKRMNSKP